MIYLTLKEEFVILMSFIGSIIERMNNIDYTLHYNHPMNNFKKGNYFGKGSETGFAKKFLKALYKLYQKKKIASISELPIPGNGIVDLVAVIENNSRYGVLSFEFKLDNWRKGIMQAHRYKEFSNSSIVVIPKGKEESASKALEIFLELGVGLWIFDTESSEITKVHTPYFSKIQDKKQFKFIIEKTLLD